MKNQKGMLILAIGAISLICTVAVFFLEVPSPTEGQWLGFSLLVFMEITFFSSLFWIRRTQFEIPHKVGMYVVLVTYALSAILIAVFWGFIWPVSVQRFIAWTFILVSVATILILLIRGAGLRYTDKKRE